MIDQNNLFVDFGVCAEKAGEAMSTLSNALNKLYKPLNFIINSIDTSKTDLFLQPDCNIKANNS